MTKKSPSPPKTAFYKVTTTITGPESITLDAVVVEALSPAEAASFMASRQIAAEPYPVDKLVAYIQAGGVPIKVPPKAKRPYAKKSTRTVSRETIDAMKSIAESSPA